MIEYYKDKASNKTLWVITDKKGEFLFTFDKKKIYNLYLDYPHNLSAEERKIFDKENPFWVDYFSFRN